MKKLRTKLFIGIFLSTVFAIVIVSGKAQAANLNGLEIPTDEKIMKYDVRTKKVIEVDNEELEQVLNNYKIKNGDTYNKLNSYNPFEAKHFSKISFTKSVHEALTKQVTDTSVFPYRTTCKVNGNIKNDKVEGTVEGSASLVGPNIALTAAHVCFIEYNKEWYTYDKVFFRPGNNGKDDEEKIDF